MEDQNCVSLQKELPWMLTRTMKQEVQHHLMRVETMVPIHFIETKFFIEFWFFIENSLIEFFEIFIERFFILFLCHHWYQIFINKLYLRKSYEFISKNVSWYKEQYLKKYFISIVPIKNKINKRRYYLFFIEISTIITLIRPWCG